MRRPTDTLRGLWSRAHGAASLLVGVALAGGGVSGCGRYERVVEYKPFLGGISEAQSQTKGVGRVGAVDPSTGGETGIVRENPDGSITLHSRSALHLMSHVVRTLSEEEEALFVEQVLSEATKDEYYARGLDPRGAFATLKARERDINLLFARMPMGEHSPNVIMRQIGAKVYRLKLTGQAARDLEWTGVDIVLERGQYRLRWFF